MAGGLFFPQITTIIYRYKAHKMRSLFLWSVLKLVKYLENGFHESDGKNILEGVGQLSLIDGI